MWKKIQLQYEEEREVKQGAINNYLSVNSHIIDNYCRLQSFALSVPRTTSKPFRDDKVVISEDWNGIISWERSVVAEILINWAIIQFCVWFTEPWCNLVRTNLCLMSICLVCKLARHLRKSVLNQTAHVVTQELTFILTVVFLFWLMGDPPPFCVTKRITQLRAVWATSMWSQEEGFDSSLLSNTATKTRPVSLLSHFRLITTTKGKISNTGDVSLQNMLPQSFSSSA